MGAVSLGGSHPGLVTLVQLLALGVLLAYAARWLGKAGAPFWLAVGVPIALGFSPAIAPTTLALWKDVPFGLMFLWAWIELLAIAVDKDRVQRWPPLVRLGIALSGVWLFRGNGPLTVLVVFVVLGWLYRRSLGVVIRVAATALAVVVLVVGPVYALFDVRRTSVEPAEVFLSDVAASFVADPSAFDADEVALLSAVAPLDLWTSKYDCYDSTALLFDPEFDQSVVRANPSPYRRLLMDVVVRDFGSVVSHRWCAANFLYALAQPEDAYFHRPPYSIPPNTVGLARDEKAQWAFDLTDPIWRWAEVDQRLWFTWRPAIVILPALATLALFAAVKRTRHFLIPSALFLGHVANVMLLSPAQEFRYAYPLYLVAALTIALAWPTVISIRTDSA